MGVNFLAVSAVCTVVSLIGLQCWTEISLEKLKVEGLISRNTVYVDNANHIIELLLRSHTIIMLVVLSVFNVFGLLILSLKTIFFGELIAAETRKLVERLANYIICKGTFLPLIIPPRISQAGLWLTWLTVLCFLKIFQALARDRLERLNASPSVTPWTYFRGYSALLLVLVVDFLWIWLCAAVSGALVSYAYWLLFFEPLSIAFETLQGVVVHGFQLMDIWLHHSVAESSGCQQSKFFNTSTAGSLWEWKGSLVRNLGFFLDMMTLLMALGHYVLIWWLHGMSFHLVDAILFLNIRALLSAMVKRIKGFIKLRIALGALHEALPNATWEEVQAYNDECAICREPMAKAKKLPCNHLFHLACLRSWLDQGLSEIYSCPTCRKPLFVGRPETEMSSHSRAVSSDEQLARQLSLGLDQPNAGEHEGIFANEASLEASGWRETGADSNWLQPWQTQGLDGAGPSNAVTTGGLGRVQRMMRHLASVRETYAQTALEDTSWGLWPASGSQATTSSNPFPPTALGHHPPSGASQRIPSHTANDNFANLLSMAETVREVLPHITDEVIFQDLQQTHNVAITINNLLQM